MRGRRCPRKLSRPALVLYLTGKRLVDFLAGRGSDFKHALDPGGVEDRDWDRVSNGRGVTQVEEGMEARQTASYGTGATGLQTRIYIAST